MKIDWAALREWTRRAMNALRPRRSDKDLEDELQAHLELAAEDAARRGRSLHQARRDAVLHHGGVGSATDALRDQRGLPWFADIFRDARYAARTLRRAPLFTAAVLLTLAIGIGANTAVFSVVNNVVLQPLAYPDADALVAVWHKAPGAEGMSNLAGDLRLSPSMYVTYSEQNRTFSNLGVWFAGTATVTGIGDPEQLRRVAVSYGTLEALGVQPLIGRWLSREDDMPGAAPVVLLGHGYWMRRFGGDASVVGRTLTVESQAREIVGVMPEGFRVVDAEPDLLTAFGFDRSRLRLPGFGLQAVARLKPGASIADASADIARLVPIWMTSWPAPTGISHRVYESWRITPALRPLKEDVVGGVAGALWILMGTLGIVMLIACANIASLLLVRADGRQQELAVRAALGAGRGRIVRALVVESVLLGAVGGALGVAVAAIAVPALVAAGPRTLPRLHEIVVDGRAVIFALTVSVLSGVLVGLVPALRYARRDSALPLRGGHRYATASKARHRTRDILVVVQVALALVLLVSSGLMMRTFQAMRAVQPGFTDAQHLQTVQISIPSSLVPEPERVARLQQDIATRLAAIPGVRAVGFATVLPMEGGTPDWDVVVPEGRDYPEFSVPPMRFFKGVSPAFFAASGTRLAAGRDFSWTDLFDRRHVVMVSENLARELWGTPIAAIGKRIRTLPTAPWREVIGVVENVYDHGVHEPAPATVYWPTFGASRYRVGDTGIDRTVTFAIRTHEAGTATLMDRVRTAVWSANASLSLASEQTLQQVYDRSMAHTSFTLVMLGIASAMALALGIIGIYGVISYAVSQRTREIGIRVALGAPRGAVKRMFVRSALRLTAAGTVIGLAAAAGLTRLMSSQLFGISQLDPATYVAVPAVLVVATLAASYIPARRAATLDPARALKAD